MTQPPGQRPNQPVPHRASLTAKFLSSIKLKMRLLGDPRISLWLKLGFIVGVIWVVFPDYIPGPIDDIAVLYLLANFEDFCPRWVVEDVRVQLEREASGEQPARQAAKRNGKGQANQSQSGPETETDEVVDAPEWSEIVYETDRDGVTRVVRRRHKQ